MLPPFPGFNPGDVCTSSTIPVRIQGSTGGNRGSRWTVTSKGCTTNPVSAEIELSTNGFHLDTVHCENGSTLGTACIEVGGVSNAFAISVNNVYACSADEPCQDAVRISRLHTASDIKLTTLRAASGTTNVVEDQVNSITLPSSTSPVEEYSFGNLTGGSPTATNQVVTTSRQTGFVLACDTFSHLPSSPPSSGSALFCCSDCVVSNPCVSAAGASGALAVWLNGAWVCK